MGKGRKKGIQSDAEEGTTSIKKKSKRENLGNILRNGKRKKSVKYLLKRDTRSNNTKHKARDGTWQVQQ